jgi:hypothetical protein
MMKKVLLGLAAAVALAIPAHAQQQRDPLGGQFGAIEVALSPAEAADQVEKMAAALAAIPPQRKGVTDTYILSASLWNDPVFENEAKEAATILGRRFDALDRTVVLSAGRGANTPRTYAAATPNNFQAALGKIGKTIDPNEDLVVIFVTSHGSPDGAVAIQEKNRMGGALRPFNLVQSLAAAGIRNKVLIVSACFSGNFILPFDNPNTVVLTAAAADKTSFGCEPQRDWTYFGDALFNHALRGGESLIDGYDEALVTISKWEQDLIDKWNALPASQRAQSPQPLNSNPQKNVGDQVAPLVVKAEAYGLSINCAAHLAFALDRARSGRPLKGLTDPDAIQAARSRYEAKAAEQAALLQHTSADTAKSIAAVAATILQVFNTQTADVSAHAGKCFTPGA